MSSTTLFKPVVLRLSAFCYVVKVCLCVDILANNVYISGLNRYVRPKISSIDGNFLFVIFNSFGRLSFVFVRKTMLPTKSLSVTLG